MEDDLVAMVRKDHPRVRRRLTRSTYAALPHVELGLFGEPERRIDRALARHGLQRNVQVVVPHVAAMPFLVYGSERVGTTMASLARMHAPSLDLRLFRPPVELAPLIVRLLWPRQASSDPASICLRDLIRKTAACSGCRPVTSGALD